MRDGSSALSSISLRTAGDNGSALEPAAASERDDGVAATAAAAGAGAVGATGFAAGATTAPLPSPIRPSSAPTATSLPTGAAISLKTPAAVALTSKVTLSVSSSTRGSSTAIASPTPFNHLATVAWLTDSPRAGTRISVDICPPSAELRGDSPIAGQQTTRRNGCGSDSTPTESASSTSRRCSASWVLNRPVAGEAAALRPT